jgi:hypothetical protein
MWVVGLMGSLAFGAVSDGCTTITARVDVLRPVEEIYEAYGMLDTAAVQAADARLVAAIPCLGVVLEPREVADVHRVPALAAMAQGDHETAKLRFAASRKLQPSYRFPPEVVPDDPN